MLTAERKSAPRNQKTMKKKERSEENVKAVLQFLTYLLKYTQFKKKLFCKIRRANGAALCTSENKELGERTLCGSEPHRSSLRSCMHLRGRLFVCRAMFEQFLSLHFSVFSFEGK